MPNVVTIMSSPILIKPWKLSKLKAYIERALEPHTEKHTVVNIGQITGGDHVLSIFLRVEEPGDLTTKMDDFLAGLNPLLSKPVEITVHDFRIEKVRHLYAGPDASALAQFEADCSKWRDMDAIDEIRFPGLDDVEDVEDAELEDAALAPAVN